MSNEKEIKDYLDTYGWSIESDNKTVVTVEVNDDSKTVVIANDLEFINKMTVSLENNVKSNSSLKPLNIRSSD